MKTIKNKNISNIISTKIRRFHLVRKEDETGISGTGVVAEGIIFTDGTCVLKWLTEVSSIGIYKSYVEMIHLHGHNGKTTISWIDERGTPNKQNLTKKINRSYKNFGD